MYMISACLPMYRRFLGNRQHANRDHVQYQLELSSSHSRHHREFLPSSTANAESNDTVPLRSFEDRLAMNIKIDTDVDVHYNRP